MICHQNRPVGAPTFEAPSPFHFAAPADFLTAWFVKMGLNRLFASGTETDPRLFSSRNVCRRGVMLWTILLILLVLWVLGAFVVPVGGGLIHLLLVLAVIVLVYQLVTGRRV
jgi:hypothetical protein